MLTYSILTLLSHNTIQVMSQSAHTTVQSQESLAAASAASHHPNVNQNPNRSADIEAALEHLESMGYAPPTSLVERTPASGFYSCSRKEQQQDEDANKVTSPPFQTQADATSAEAEEDPSISIPCWTTNPPQNQDDETHNENIAGALLHMSTVYHYAPPDSILNRSSTTSLSHSTISVLPDST